MNNVNDDTPWDHEPVPRSAIRLFRLCWQLETWLRLLVYVELRAARIDWEEPIKKRVSGWPPSSIQNDKRLHHMTTPHQAALSYLTLGQLWEVISHPDNWPCFAPYFPPKHNTEVRIEEIKAIRNRIAHFREPHAQDEARFDLFLRDFDPGLQRFCTRYTMPIILTDDKVTEHLAESWSSIGYGIELERPRGWLYAPEPRRMKPLMNAQVRVMSHANHKRGCAEGLIYRLTLIPPSSGHFDAVGFLETTKALHKDIIHIMLYPSISRIMVTVPAVHGVDVTAETIATFLDAGRNNIGLRTLQNLERNRFVWPEYVLWPGHLLASFHNETIFDLT